MSRTPMKLILTQEVTGLGAPGDVVEVAGGYGRNYLVPRGLDDAKQAAGRLGALKVRLATKAGNTGRLFGSVSPSDIADAVRAAGGPDLDRRRIEVPSPIKTIGAHQVRVRLHPEVTATIEIEIVGN